MIQLSNLSDMSSQHLQCSPNKTMPWILAFQASTYPGANLRHRIPKWNVYEGAGCCVTQRPMVAQVTAVALASENKSLAHPTTVDSSPTWPKEFRQHGHRLVPDQLAGSGGRDLAS